MTTRRKSQIITVDDEAAIIAKYKTGKGMRLLGREYGCRGDRIKDILIKNNIGLRSPGGGRYTESEIQGMIEDYTSGMSQKAIGEKYGLNQTSVGEFLRRRNVPIRAYGEHNIDKELRDKIKELKESGKTQKEISRELNIDFTRTGRYFEKLGYERDNFAYASGMESHAWKGGRTKNGGYILIRLFQSDPLFQHTNAAGYMLEHRYIMANYLGRPLERYETVHHIDGNTENNTLSNLQLRTGRHGKGVAMVCNSCGSHDVSSTKLED